MRGRLPLLLLPLLAMLAPGMARACTIDPNYRPTPAAVRAEARRAVREATAIIDGEVIRPAAGYTPALVRAHRVLKGPRQAIFAVGVQDSCSMVLTTPGQRSRLILFGGPDVYFADINTPGERAVDRLLGSDRRRDWPYVAGEEAAP
jgi:hypothetical protein